MTEDNDRVRNLVLFDGVCVFCSASMRFLFKHDRQHRLWFASLQGKVAEDLQRRGKPLPEGLSSVVFIENYGQPAEKIYLHSDAALRVTRKLAGFWKVLSWALIIPRPIRDAVYEWVARNRYRWFGRKESCSLPEPAIRARFLDG